jgi:hypothetical protein
VTSLGRLFPGTKRLLPAVWRIGHIPVINFRASIRVCLFRRIFRKPAGMCSISASAYARQAKDSNWRCALPCESLFCGACRETFLLHLCHGRLSGHASDTQKAPSAGEVFHRRCREGALAPSEHCPDSHGSCRTSRFRRVPATTLNLNAKPTIRRSTLDACSDEGSRSSARPQASTSASSANSWMNSRRGSTRSPMRRENISSAVSACSTFTCSRRRAFGSSVVSHSCSGFISPRPL